LLNTQTKCHSAKKYVCWLSSILRKEYADAGIVIQTVCPMMVATKMAKVRKPSFFTPSAEKFTAEAVRSIGHIDETTGCLAHQIQVCESQINVLNNIFSKLKAEVLFGYLPAFLLDKLMKGTSLQTRKKALKKKQEAAAKSE
jgi:17beta-estradiol 17-dehydrogenase / very-long-chain 3-oxoacyl-CoA reductase